MTLDELKSWVLWGAHWRVAATQKLEPSPRVAALPTGVARGPIARDEFIASPLLARVGYPQTASSARTSQPGLPVVVDALDAHRVTETVANARPDVIVVELTAIPPTLDLRHFDRDFELHQPLADRRH